MHSQQNIKKCENTFQLHFILKIFLTLSHLSVAKVSDSISCRSFTLCNI